MWAKPGHVVVETVLKWLAIALACWASSPYLKAATNPSFLLFLLMVVMRIIPILSLAMILEIVKGTKNQFLNLKLVSVCDGWLVGWF